MIENSNDCCTTQDLTWTKVYSQAAECNREEKFRMIYADQDEQRGCVKVISRTALSFMPVLISELICGCSCLLLGLWTMYVIFHVHDNYTNSMSNDQFVQVAQSTIPPLTKHSDYQTNYPMHNMISDKKTNDSQPNRFMINHKMSHHSNPSVLFNNSEKYLQGNRINS